MEQIEDMCICNCTIYVFLHKNYLRQFKIKDIWINIKLGRKAANNGNNWNIDHSQQQCEKKVSAARAY
jgi:hypothetical protein